MEKINYKSFLTSITSIFIIILIVTFSPANAVTISLTSTPTSQFNEIATFIAKIDIATNERVPFQNITAIIKNESNSIVAICDFDIDGNKLSSCDASFVTISKLTTATQEQDNLNGTGFGSNTTSPDSVYTTEFGYGYGFIDSNTLNELQYEISWKTPNLLIAQQTYTVELEVNAQNAVNSFTYKLETPTTINVEIQKPIARLQSSTFEAETNTILNLDASTSTDPNLLPIINYQITKNGNIIISSSTPTLNLPINFTGIENFNLTITNSIGATSTPLEFSVTGISKLNQDNFDLEVDSLIKNGNINFKITTTDNFTNTRIKIKPQIECLNIKFDYKPKFLSTMLTLTKTNQEFPLTIKREDFDLNIPTQNDCNFKIILINTQTQEQTTLTRSLQFYDSIEQIPNDENIDVAIDNGNELINYIYQSFGKSFQRGYNSINFNFKNERRTDIKTEIKITIPKLSLESYEDIRIDGNSDSKVMIPLYISKDIKPGVYPMRISYRINDGELKTKYGFVDIK